MDGEERAPVLLMAQGVPGPESSSPQLPTLDDFQAKHKELEAKRAEHRRDYERFRAEMGIGTALAAEPDSASESSAAQGHVAVPDSSIEAQGSGWQCIPSELLRTGFARLASAAGHALVSDGNGPGLGQEGSRELKPQIRTQYRWEKLWRFFALSMDSADEQSGYLDKFRFEDLLKKRARISDRAVIKKLWTIAIASGAGIQSSDAAGKLRYSQQEEDGPEGFVEFVEAWGEQIKSWGQPKFEARRTSSGRSSGSAAIVAGASTGVVRSDWADLARQRAIALPPAELAKAFSLPTLQPDQKEALIRGLRRLRKVSAKSGNSKTEWQQIFSKFDTDHSNRLELKEFTNMLRYDAVGMQTRDSKWFKDFVPELYKFMSQEHVRSMGGITGEEFSRLLHVRTVEGV